MTSSESNSQPTYLGPFAIALVALAISVATSVWSISEARTARGNSDDTASIVKSAMGKVSGPDRTATTNQPAARANVPRLKAATASISAAGTVTKHSGDKPKVTAADPDALADVLGPVLPDNLFDDAAGMWCLSGGPWSIKNIGAKVTSGGGPAVTDSSHEVCSKGLFVATRDQQKFPKAMDFSVTIYWVGKD